MRTYGQTRNDSPGRNIRGTSRPCPCCTRDFGLTHKKKARRSASKEIDSGLVEFEIDEWFSPLNDWLQDD